MGCCLLSPLSGLECVGAIINLTPLDPWALISFRHTAHFSENWGFLSISPIAGGNLFSLAFGSNLDAHAPADTANSTAILRRAAPSSSLQCLEGRACYISTIYLTLGACLIALILSIWAGWRDRQRMLAKEGGGGLREAVDVVWDAPES